MSVASVIGVGVGVKSCTCYCRKLLAARKPWSACGAMPATMIKLSNELEARVANVIDGTGQSMHAFLLEAVERQTRTAEQRRTFVEDALASRTEALQSGTGCEADAVHAHLRARAAGRKSTRPKARSWRG
jgi:predicted transcriptional regulator